MSTAVATNLPSDIAARMSGTPFWTNVRVARQMLAGHFQKPWDPNYSIPEQEKWIHITAIKIGEVSITGPSLTALQTYESSVENAAQAISKGTHRLATDEEISAFKRGRREREEFCRSEEERINPSVAAAKASNQATIALTRAAEAMTRNAQDDRNEADPERGKGKQK